MRAHKVAAAIGVALLALLVMTSVAAAQQKANDVQMTGTIVAIDGEKYLIKTPEGERVFKFKDGVPRPANLTPGTQVTMMVDEDDVDDNPPGEKVESEVYTIHQISVVEAQAPPITDVPPPATPVTPVEPAPVTPPPVASTPAEPMTELPETASPVEILGLVGLIAFAGGLGLTIWQKRREE